MVAPVVNRRTFHGPVSPEGMAQALLAEFGRGTLRAQQIGQGDHVEVQIASRPGHASGGPTALTVQLQSVEDGVLVQIGQQAWFGVAASLAQTGLWALKNPWTLISRLDDLAEDLASIGMADRVWSVLTNAAEGAGASQCGARLGPLSDLYTSPAAAADLEVVLDALGVPAVDLYGDSYGSFLAQTFAVRYPQRVRTLLLDGTYPIEGLDPWYRTTPVRLRENLALFCARSPLTCPVTPDRVLARVRKAVELLRASPLTTSAPGGDGSETDVTLTPRRVADVLLYSDSAPGYVRESIAAVEALLAGNPRPLARMVAESEVDPADAAVRRTPRAELRGYSEGAYLAYACSDYPQLWNVNASFPARENQFAAAVGGLAPGAVSPWTSTEWADTEFFTYDYCLHWPKPRVVDPPFPAGGRYPSTPTLVLNGDLDLRTDLYQAREVSANFPRSSYVQVPNAGHVTALYDADSCASSIARTFVETRAMGGTGCLAHIPEHRIVQRFAEAAADAPPADVASGADRSRPADRRASRVAVEALADVIDRWYAIPGFGGSGLYGGKFTMTSTDTSPFASRVWTLALKKLKWTQDVEVSGIATVPRGPGTASASLTVKGAGTDAGDLTVTWSTRQPGAKARIRGTIGGRAVDLSTPAPSFY